MKYDVYKQSICSSCLQYLVNGEPHDNKEEQTQCEKTLKAWAENKYVEAGLADNTEPSFSHLPCDLCNCKAGDRYEYNFFDQNEVLETVNN